MHGARAAIFSAQHDLAGDRTSLIPEGMSYKCKIGRNHMATAENPNQHLEYIGVVVQIAGIASMVAGVVLSLHHWPAAAALIVGGVAYVVGKTLRAE
jgi:hypothetical protein